MDVDWRVGCSVCSKPQILACLVAEYWQLHGHNLIGVDWSVKLTVHSDIQVADSVVKCWTFQSHNLMNAGLIVHFDCPVMVTRHLMDFDSRENLYFVELFWQLLPCHIRGCHSIDQWCRVSRLPVKNWRNHSFSVCLFLCPLEYGQLPVGQPEHNKNKIKKINK